MLLREVQQCVEVTDLLDLVCSGLRGELRLALLALALTMRCRAVRSMIARRRAA